MRPLTSRVVELHEPETAEVVPLTDRMARRSLGPDGAPFETPAWVGHGPDASVRPLFAPPPPVIAPAPPPDPSKDTAFQAELQELRARAEEDAWQAGQRQVDAVCEGYLEGIARLERVTRDAARPSANEVVSLALVVAREILGRELRADREAIVAVVDEALHQAGREAPVRIRLARADLDMVSRKRKELIDAGVQLVEDASVQPGGCVVENARRVVDATVEARIAAVRGGLLALFAEPVAEPERERFSVVASGSAA